MRASAVILATALLLAVAGCGGGDESTTAEAPNVPSAAKIAAQVRDQTASKRVSCSPGPNNASGSPTFGCNAYGVFKTPGSHALIVVVAAPGKLLRAISCQTFGGRDLCPEDVPEAPGAPRDEDD